MGQHQAKIDNSGPSPPPIFGYEPGYGAYPLGNPPKEVLAIQESRKNGLAPPTFFPEVFPTLPDKMPTAPVLSSTVPREVSAVSGKMPPGGFPFPPFQGRPVIPSDVSAFLANAPPFPKSPVRRKQSSLTNIAAPGKSNSLADTNNIDIDFDITDLDIPCDPCRKNNKEQPAKSDKPTKFLMNSLLNIPSDLSECSGTIPVDPSKKNPVLSSVNLEETKNFQETYYDEPANESTQPPPLPPRNRSLPQNTFFNPFGMLPTPLNSAVRNFNCSILSTDGEEVFKTSEDQRSEKDIVKVLSSLIRLMPVLWAPKFSTKIEVQQVEDAWEEIGRKVGCTDVWPLQRMKIVWLTNVAKLKKSANDQSFEYYKDMEFLIPIMKVRPDASTPVRKPGRKSSSTCTFVQEYEDDYIPPQKIRNIAFAGL